MSLKKSIERFSQKHQLYAFHFADLGDWWQVDIMRRDGIAKAYFYQYEDQMYQGVLSGLHVDTRFRKNGLGLQLQEMREDLAQVLGCERVQLFCEKDSWMRKWYEKRGYKENGEYERKDPRDKEDMIWMVKEFE